MFAWQEHTKRKNYPKSYLWHITGHDYASRDHARNVLMRTVLHCMTTEQITVKN